MPNNVTLGGETVDLTIELMDKSPVCIINKRKVRSTKDKEILARTINAMCRLCSFSAHFEPWEVDEIIDDTNGLYTAFTATYGGLEFFYDTKKNKDGTFCIR